MQVILESNWSWMLFEEESDFYLSVVCGSSAIFTRELRLSEEEVLAFRNNGESALDDIASAVRYRPQHFDDRHIKGFMTRDDVRTAILDWKINHGAKR